MKAQRTLGFVLLSAAAACGGTDVKNFTYGGGQPGAALAEGGEIRHENVRILGMPEQTWIQVYQYDGPTASVNAPFPAPADKGMGMYGNCVDERDNSTETWPFKQITGATYLDLPMVNLTGPGITGTLAIVKTNPPNMAGNSTFRHHDFTYGGGAPGNPPMGFNGTLTAADSTPGGHYTLDIGDGVTPAHDYYIPAAYTTPVGIGGSGNVSITAHQDLTLTWTAPPNDFGTDGKTHTKNTYFNFTFFADPTASTPPQFICFPDADGHQVIPAAVIDALPAGGLIVNADLSHYLDHSKGPAAEDRRFDLVSIYCNISTYSKQ